MSSLNIAEEMGVALPERSDAATTHPTRPFLWSILRELWDNPSIVVAPAAVGLLLVIATLVAAVRFTGPLLLKLGEKNLALSTVAIAPFLPVPMFLGITMVLVAAFYSLDALLGERQDRSILFWKSLPVSDSLTVLSKMAVPIVILPIVTFVVAIATDILIFVIETIALLVHHAPVVSSWAGIPVVSILALMAYAAVVVTLWYAPIYAWFLLVSAWVRRIPLITAVAPFILLPFFEKIAFHTDYVRNFIGDRIGGVFTVAFLHQYTEHSHNHAVVGYNGVPLNSLLTPGHFLATPGLWGGLLFAALALFLIIRLRRSSGPI
jgi:ABC-2 type transport system permease protein